MRTKQRNNLAETARHERVAQNTDVYAVKARNYKGLRRGSPVFRMNSRMGQELEKAVLTDPFDFTKNMPVLKIPVPIKLDRVTSSYGSQLFDLKNDPDQVHPICDHGIEARMCEAMECIMNENDAPEELFLRMGLNNNH